MIAILGGLGAAAMWAAATVCSSRSSRAIGAGPVLAWVMLVGLIATLPFVAMAGVPPGLDGEAVIWLLLAGTGNVAGLLLEYAALRVGKVGIVAPIASTEGAVAAVLALIAGERIAPGAGAMLAVIVAGVVLASAAPDGGPLADRPDGRRAIGLSIAAALFFGVGLYAAGRISLELPVAWVLLPPRVIGVAAVAIPLAASGRLRTPGRVWPLVVASGVCEIAGFALFALGARDQIAVAAVLASQFAALAAIGAYVLFRERLRSVQLAGVVAIACGVAVLTWLQA